MGGCSFLFVAWPDRIDRDVKVLCRCADATCLGLLAARHN